MRRDDVLRIRHMLDALDAGSRFIAERARADLDSDDMLLFALVRAVEIVGEAASKISPEGRAMLPTVPWADVIGMRNRVVHAYFDINRDILWSTAVTALPDLGRTLRCFLDEAPESDGSGGHHG